VRPRRGGRRSLQCCAIADVSDAMSAMSRGFGRDDGDVAALSDAMSTMSRGVWHCTVFDLAWCSILRAVSRVVTWTRLHHTLSSTRRTVVRRVLDNV